jgi:hypothetical protein
MDVVVEVTANILLRKLIIVAVELLTTVLIICIVLIMDGVIVDITDNII